MPITLSHKSYRLITGLVALLIVKVILFVVYSYRDYFPPDFDTPFLLGRENYFWQSYARSFYLHLFSGPLTLFFGLLLISDRFRQRWPSWHRILGRIQVALILLILVPSGLWMSLYAQTGGVAGTGLAASAIAVGVCAILGWRTAVNRQFRAHRVWMLRCFAILCSAVVIRVIGGLSTVAGWEQPWIYPFSTWFSWIFPLACIELRSWICVSSPHRHSSDVPEPVGSNELSASS